MKQINSKQTGQGVLSPLQSAVSVCMVFVWILSIVIAYGIGLPMWAVLIVFAGVAAIVGVLFFTIIIDKTRFNRTVTNIKHRLRVRRGDASIHTFVLPLKQLKKHIPIERVHDDGLIEYSKRRFGVLFRYDPPNVPSSELGGFHKQMEYIANSFAPGIEASFHFYNMIDRTTPLADTVLKSLNTEGKTLEQKKHLHGMYAYATKSNEPTVSTAYLLSIKLGQFKSAEHAMIAHKSTVPGILKAMRERGIYATPVIGENEIAVEFRQFAAMEKY